MAGSASKLASQLLSMLVVSYQQLTEGRVVVQQQGLSQVTVSC